MPDANKENTINQLVGAAFGAAGQRCMALSTAIFVGDSREWLPELVERSKSLRVNAGKFVVGHGINGDFKDYEEFFITTYFNVKCCSLILLLVKGVFFCFLQVISPGQTWGP